MSPRGSRRVPVSPSKSRDYLHVAENFRQGAEAARAFEYWNAAGLLAVHAAIAYTDALTIHVGGVKCRGEDHMAAADLLREIVLMDDAGNKAAVHLLRLLEQKNLVSYSGEIYAERDVETIWKHLERYRPWVLGLLGS